MVTLTILTIISVVAIPQYNVYKRNAKQTEAQANLSSVYLAQQMFYSANSQYYRNLWAIGWEPAGDLNYRVFMTGTVVTAPPIGFASSPNLSTEYNDTFFICSSTFAGGLSDECKYDVDAFPSFAEVPNETTFTVSNTSFTVGAAAKLGGDELVDVWTINDFKELINTHNGAL